MKARSWLSATVVAALLAPGAASAQGIEGRFSIAFQAGTLSEISGDLMKSTQGTLVGKPVTIDSKRYRDVYAPDVRWQGQLAYGVSEKVEIVARGTYYKAEGTAVEAGTFDGGQLAVYFDPYGAYEEAGLELGARYYIASTGKLKSYLGVVAGARFLSEVLITFSAAEAGTSIQNVPFSEEGTVAVFGLDLGFTFDLGGHFFVGLDSALRYQTAPTPFEPYLELRGFNHSEGRWSAPVVATLGVRF